MDHESENLLILELKRILSPEDGAPMGRIRKYPTLENNSPILKERTSNWNGEDYETYNRKVGEVNEVGEIKLDVERIKKTPIRRLSVAGKAGMAQEREQVKTPVRMRGRKKTCAGSPNTPRSHKPRMINSLFRNS